MEKEIKCHDCQVQAQFEGDEIKNGVIAVYSKDGENIEVFKCQKCFDKNKNLNNFQNCEVYYRVVGYLRPVKQWHLGKQEEFTDRKEYQA
jgi:anaerobic ribonucleoside-triphosphate reductase